MSCARDNPAPPVPDSTIIAPEGEVDIARIAEFRAALAGAVDTEAACVVVDLSRVSFIDSTGLGALVELQRHLWRDKRQLAVVAPAGTATSVLLDLAGLRGKLAVFETREAALASAW